MDSGLIATQRENHCGMECGQEEVETELEVRGYRLRYRGQEEICCDDLSEPSFRLPRLATFFPSPFTLRLEMRSLNTFKLGILGS